MAGQREAVQPASCAVYGMPSEKCDIREIYCTPVTSQQSSISHGQPCSPGETGIGTWPAIWRVSSVSSAIAGTGPFTFSVIFRRVQLLHSDTFCRATTTDCSRLTTEFTRRSFSYSVPVIWTSLNANSLLCNCESNFKRQLKTFLFNSCFYPAWLTPSPLVPLSVASRIYKSTNLIIIVISRCYCFKLWRDVVERGRHWSVTSSRLIWAAVI